MPKPRVTRSITRVIGIPTKAISMAISASWLDSHCSRKRVKAQTRIMPIAMPDMNILLNISAVTDFSSGLIPNLASRRSGEDRVELLEVPFLVK